MAEHPLRLQLTVKDEKGSCDLRMDVTDLEQGTVLSHLSFKLGKTVSKSDMG